MPLIITRGAASTLGLWSSGRNLTTATFTSNGTWVAPASVGMVSVLSGYGAPGQGDYTGGIGTGTLTQTTGTTQPNAPYLDYSSVYSYYLSLASKVTAGGLQNLYYRYWYIDSSNNWGYQDVSIAGVDPTYIIPGQSYPNIWGSRPTSGNVLFTDPSVGINQGVSVILPGSAGAPASALGETFPGGTISGGYPTSTGNPATPATYTNISVTPGASYSIVVPTGGQIQIGYYT